jgi:hypothetical protein
MPNSRENGVVFGRFECHQVIRRNKKIFHGDKENLLIVIIDSTVSNQYDSLNTTMEALHFNSLIATFFAQS